MARYSIKSYPHITMAILRNKLLQLFPSGHPAGLFNRLRGLRVYRSDRRKWLRSEDWKFRLATARRCRENALLDHVKNAGEQQDDCIIMHNGLLVESGGYYGPSANVLLAGNRGVHEPQEEYLFREVLRQLPSGASILELGAYWGFYSMWFKRDVPLSKCFLVEAEPDNLAVGVRNFERNVLRPDGTLLARIGRSVETSPSNVPTMTVDAVLEHFGIKHLSLLHADIQGHEFDMLQGASIALENRTIDILFISTHSMEVHYRCKTHLVKCGYLVPWSIDLVDSYSFDGLIVAHLPGAISDDRTAISLRSADL
jgi:hypothetical protein